MAAFSLTETEGGSGGFREFREVTASDTFVVPSGIFSLRVLLQGGGGRGGNGTPVNNSGGGGSAGHTLMGILQVAPGETLTLTVGAAGGDSYIEKGTVTSAIALGGNNGTTATAGGLVASNNPMSLMSGSVVHGRSGGNGTTSGSGGVGPSASAFSIGGTTGSFAPQPSSLGGTSDGGSAGGGGGGSSSYFGKGGDGGAGVNGGSGVNGGDALVYGAGGGGGGEGSSNGAGGTGGAGVIQLWY